MLRFYFIDKLKVIICINTLIKYLAWCLFFIYQGKAIEIAISKSDKTGLIYTLIWYVIFKVITMLCDINHKFISEHYKNKELKKSWKKLFPNKIYKDNEQKSDLINVLFNDHLPKLFDLEVSIVSNVSSVIIIFILSIVFFLITGFYQAAIALLIIFILNYLSKNIFVSDLEKSEREIEKCKLAILKWTNQFFCSYKEISRVWDADVIINWRNNIYNNYYNTRQNNIFLYLYKDLMAQVLIEIPFLCNTALVLYAVYFNYLSISQMFVWVGISQFMINASNSLLINQVKNKNKRGIYKQIVRILRDFRTNKINDGLVLVNTKHNLQAKVALSDGTENTLGAIPNIYHITGANGSGKSTLLNIIIGYERKMTIYSKELKVLICYIKNFGIRYIDREVVIFDDLNNFTLQVCGPAYSIGNRWAEPILKNMSLLFDNHLTNKWIKIFKDLETKYESRADKALSSGEKVVLSFMRVLFSWDKEINLLVIDECDSFLDNEKKELFNYSIKAISSHAAVYHVKHEYLGNERKDFEYSTDSFC